MVVAVLVHSFRHLVSHMNVDWVCSFVDGYLQRLACCKVGTLVRLIFECWCKFLYYISSDLLSQLYFISLPVWVVLVNIFCSVLF